MFKSLIKLAVFVLVVMASATVFSSGKAFAYACPGGLTGTNVPADYGYDAGEAADGFAGVVVATSYGSGNGWSDPRNGSRLDQGKYLLESSVPNAPFPYRYNLGGRPQDDRIFTVNSANNTVTRTDSRWFGTGGLTGDNLYANAGDSGYTCPGWDALGPGRVYTDPSTGKQYEEAGNRHALDCGESYYATGNPNPMGKTNTHFWIGQIPNPNGEDGHWEVEIYGAANNPHISIGDIGATPMSAAGTHFEVTNGATVRINLIWHENKPKSQTVPTTGACEYLKVANNGSGNANNRRVYVEVTGISLGRERNNGDASTDQTWAPGNPSDPSRPSSIAAWVGGDPGDKGIPKLGPGDTAPYKEWWFVPWGSNSIHVKVTVQDYWDNTADGVNNPTWNTISGYPQYLDNNGNWSTTDQSRDCYTGTCNVVSATGNGPGGVVLKNDWIHIHATLTNTSKDSLQLWGEQLVGTGGTQSGSEVLDPGDTHDFYFDIPSPSSVQAYPFSFYPNYPSPGGGGQIGGNCGGVSSVDVYEPFTLTPHATLTYQGTAEYPRTITYSTYGQNDSSQTIPAPSSSSFTYTPYSGGTGCPNAGPVGTPAGQFAPGGPDYTISPTTCAPSSYEAGDLYCSQMSLTGYNQGWVGPGGNIVDTSLDPSNASDQHCLRIINEPYFKVKGANVSAGGDFDTSGTGVCTGGGLLGGYDDNVDNPNRGSGSELSALALIKITGVASAQGAYSTSAPSGTALTFANTNAGDISSNYDSPNLGGNFDPGGSHCLTDQSPSSTSTSVNGPYKQPGKANITDNESIFVTGDVRIMGNITYGSGWTIDNVPSFVLHATGNIYIDPSVTQLDGTYVSNKKVYTCDNNGFSPMPASQMYTSCRNQLEVNGSVTAQHINMQRTFGSLRDERPGGDVAPGAEVDFVWSSAGPVSGMRCTQINESADPHTWTDNYLCVPNSTDIHLAWTHHSDNPDGCAGVKFKNYVPIKGSDPGEASESCLQSNGFPSCIQWNAVGDPDTWTDNYLCANQDLGLSFNTSQIAGKYCGTNLLETADPDGKWSTTGYYLCQPQAPPTGPLCSNAGTQVDPKSCAGEIFNFSPEIFLSTPAIQLPNNGAVQYDAVTSKPPVL